MMKLKNKIKDIKFFLILIISLCYPVKAFAYFDPGLGAFILQGIVVFVSSIILFFRKAFLKIVNKIRNKKKKDD